MNTENPRRLGRGLEALIKTAKPPMPVSPVAIDNVGGGVAVPSAGKDPPRIAISSIRANPFQPRREFKPAELKDLEDSLRTTGLLQPITVRPSASGIGFELAAGERRLRAATNLGWSDI